MDIKITYFDFADINKFAGLIQRFQAQDEWDPPENDNTYDVHKLVDYTCKNDLTIAYKADMENTYKISFIVDFLIPRIEKNEPFNEYENFIKEEINKKFKYKPTERRLFIRDEINNLENLLKKVNEEPYFLYHFRESIYNQIEQSIKILFTDESLYDKKDNSQKIRVKLSRNELTCLFLLLRQAGFIDHKYEKEFGQLLEQNFMYFNTNENSYKELTNINKLLSDMGNGHKLINTASETLKEILSKPEFYELKP